MDESPKRSARETITELIVIAILLALIVASVIYLRQYIDSRSASAGDSNAATSRETFSFTCCTGFTPTTIYRPGQDIRLTWSAVPEVPGSRERETITLSEMLSKQFSSAREIKSGVNPGPFIAESSTRVSNRSDTSPVTFVRIPLDARRGYYDLVTSSSEGGVSQSGATIFKIR